MGILEDDVADGQAVTAGARLERAVLGGRGRVAHREPGHLDIRSADLDPGRAGRDLHGPAGRVVAEEHATVRIDRELAGGRIGGDLQERRPVDEDLLGPGAAGFATDAAGLERGDRVVAPPAAALGRPRRPHVRAADLGAGPVEHDGPIEDDRLAIDARRHGHLLAFGRFVDQSLEGPGRVLDGVGRRAR